MKDIVFLIPPSEGKVKGGEGLQEHLSFSFDRPYNIGVHATQKDLKCQGQRYEEAIQLNTNIEKGPFLESVYRYSGVMYSAIDYNNMALKGQNFFEKHFLIVSGMYGILRPFDTIANYKLPIEVRGLYHFWGEKITNILIEIQPKYIVNLLPGAYQKMIDFSRLESKVIHINFLTKKDDQVTKLTHGVKKVKGEWIKNICEKGIQNYNGFGGGVEKHDDSIHINIF